MVNVDISFLFKVFTSTHFLCSILCVCAHVRSTHTYMHACMCVYVWVYVCVQHLCMSVCFSKGISFSSDIKGCHTCILTSPENVIAMHSDFTRKHFYAFWLHQQTLLCILTSPENTATTEMLCNVLTSPENTAMHSDKLPHRPHMSANSTYKASAVYSHITQTKVAPMDVTPAQVTLVKSLQHNGFLTAEAAKWPYHTKLMKHNW